MKALTLLVLPLLLAACSSVPHQPTTNDADAIHRVIETFRTAIIARDKPGFLALFHDGPLVWQSVLSDATVVRAREKRPDSIKARVNPVSTPQSFIETIASDEKRNEEKFWNIQIHTDGDIAAVTFDYAYFYDNAETNHGKESWLLVRTEGGWKITSVVYSVDLPDKRASAK